MKAVITCIHRQFTIAMAAFVFPLLSERIFGVEIQDVLQHYDLQSTWPSLQVLGFDSMERFALLSHGDLDQLVFLPGHKYHLITLGKQMFVETGMSRASLLGNFPPNVLEYLKSAKLEQHHAALVRSGYDTLHRFALLNTYSLPADIGIPVGHQRMMTYMAYLIETALRVLRGSIPGHSRMSLSTTSSASLSNDTSAMLNTESSSIDEESTTTSTCCSSQASSIHGFKKRERE